MIKKIKTAYYNIHIYISAKATRMDDSFGKNPRIAQYIDEVVYLPAPLRRLVFLSAAASRGRINSRLDASQADAQSHLCQRNTDRHINTTKTATARIGDIETTTATRNSSSCGAAARVRGQDASSSSRVEISVEQHSQPRQQQQQQQRGRIRFLERSQFRQEFAG